MERNGLNMNLKLISLTMLMIILVSACFGVTAYASEGREVLIYKWDELSYAAENCGDGDIIKLEADIYSEKTLYFDLWSKVATLDLNGHKLEIVCAGSNAVRINGFNGELIITDSEKSGVLKASCRFDNITEQSEIPDTAAIRVSSTMQTLIIDNAAVEALGGAYGPGIGSVTSEVGNIIIRNSDVSATGGIFGAGIGGGFERFAGNIIIESGNIAAAGGDFAAAIGTGGFTAQKDAGSVSNSILITGGNIFARGGLNAAGIGGGQLQAATGVKIEDGKITALGGSCGAGIGTGKLNLEGINAENGFMFSKADIFINGGNIKVTGGEYAAGIGTGEGSCDYSTEEAAQNRLVKIDGGNIVAIGGTGGAGIGGGAYLSGGRVEIAQTENKTYVEASGGAFGAGLGGGLAGLTGAMIRVYDGRVIAHGGDNAAGIGGGEFSINRMEPNGEDFIDLKNIVVTGGRLNVKAGKNAAAIGGGSCGSGSCVVFSGAALVKAESEFENSIGAGKHAVSQGSVTIDGGNIIINKKMGPIPKNSRQEPLYEGEIKVVSSILDNPIGNVEIQAKLTDYIYKAVTEQDGGAKVYFPRSDNVALEVLTDGVTASSGTEYVGEPVEIVLNEGKVKILSEEYTYFADGENNTFQMAYAGDAENLKFEIGGDTDIAINAQTGLMTFPVQLKYGDYNFPVYAYINGELIDEADFHLSVVESLSGVKTDEYVINTDADKTALLKINPQPGHNAVSEVFWKVTANDAKGYELTEVSSDDGEYYAEFTAQLPGRYAVTATVMDINKNTASTTFDITVNDPYKIDGRVEAYAAGVVRQTGHAESYPPEINAWLVERISAAKVYIDFYASCGGKYFYEAVKAGEKRTGDYTGGFTAFMGNNRIECDLPDAGAYDFYVALEDNLGTVSEPLLIRVESFTSPDIIPPELSEFKVVRDADSAYVSFTSDKEGFFKYAAYENGISAASAGNDFCLPQPMNAGENKFTVNKLKSESFCDVMVAAYDASENTTPKYAFSIEAYDEPVETGILVNAEDAANIEYGITLAKDFVISGGDSVMVGIVSDTGGEYYYGMALGNAMPLVDMEGKGGLLAEGKNAIRLSGLETDMAYRVGIAAKNEEARSPVLIVEIPAEKPAINITGLSAVREPSRVSLNFYSDKEGVLNYAVLREGDGIPEKYSTEIIYEGRNRIYIDDAAGGDGAYVSAIAQDKEGKFGEFIRAEIKG